LECGWALSDGNTLKKEAFFDGTMAENYLFKVIVSVVIFNGEKNVLLARRSMTEDVLPGYWGIPGGKAETRGTIEHFLELELKREVKEEVGIEIEDIQYVGSQSHESGKINIFFSAKWKSGEAQALDDTDKVGWFDLKDIEKMQLTPRTPDTIKQAARLRSY
jgi:ADP-ribose pyrophosphatase YjhB (NUDIX family)